MAAMARLNLSIPTPQIVWLNAEAGRLGISVGRAGAPDHRWLPRKPPPLPNLTRPGWATDKSSAARRPGSNAVTWTDDILATLHAMRAASQPILAYHKEPNR